MSNAEETILRTPGGRLRLRWLSSNTLRVTHASPGDEPFPDDRPWLADILPPSAPHPPASPELRIDHPEGRLLAVVPGGLEIFSEKRPPRLDLRHSRFHFSPDPTRIELRAGFHRVEGGVRLSLGITPGESFYGWGEQFNAFRRQSGNVQLKIRDAIAPLQGRGETYTAIPFFLSSRGYGFVLLNSYTSRWKIDPQRQELEIEADGPHADYILIYGPSYKRILETYTALTGRPPLLPRWAFGLWVTSYPQGHQEGVLAHVREHRQRQIPLDAAILDYHWEERFHNFRWRSSLFPDPQGLIDGMNDLGARLGLITTPFVNRRNRPVQKFILNRVAHNVPATLEQDDERALAEYQLAKQQGYLAHEDAIWWFGSGGMIDFSNHQAADWWNSLARPLYDQGVAFFKNDDGEYLPEEARSALGMDGREYHNLYGFYYGRAMFEGMLGLGRRALIYARSGWIGSQRYPALFLGDQTPTFESIRSTLRAGLNLGLMGFAYWTADVFGLAGKTTPETHMRYAQWALMSPVARYFWRPPEIDDTRFPWSHGPEVEANFRKYTELRYRLLPYFTTLGWEAHRCGLPILRPLALEFQEDDRLAGVENQALLGDGLMICPVVEAGVRQRRIRLPQGVWHDFWTEETWLGPGEIDYPAPLDRLPMLARGGTILPMGPVLQHIPDDHRFDELQFHIWPPYPASGSLYEDDGASLEYLRGARSLTQVRAEEDERQIVVKISPAEGNFAGQPVARRVELILHRSAAPAQAQVNGQISQDWDYDAAAGEIRLRLSCSIFEETVIQIIKSGP
jgi:alpha-glucosidase (family GH31 glycosyl hydrolase)